MSALLLAWFAVGAVAHADGSGSAAGPTVIQITPDAAAPEVSAAASPSEIELGKRFTLFVTATFGEGVEVNLREPIDLGGAFEVKRKFSEDRLAPDGRHVREWQLEVYAWELGELRVPPVAVTFTAGGHAAQVETNTVPLHVVGVLGEVDDPKLMRESAPPVPLWGRDLFWLWVASGAGVLLAAVLAGVTLRRRHRRRVVQLVATAAPAAPRRRIDMTSERALERLLAIERSGVLDRDDERPRVMDGSASDVRPTRKHGYAEMVEVIRDYLGARYRVATLDLTTSELIRALAPAAPAEERALVETWLERCDLVKYGGLRATPDEARDVLAQARELVLATTAQPRQEAA